MNGLAAYYEPIDEPTGDELDQAIERMIAEPQTTRVAAKDRNAADSSLQQNVKSGLVELLEIAADLRDLPRPEFKMRLRLELDWQAAGRLVSLDPGHAQNEVTVPDNRYYATPEILPSLFAAPEIYAPRRAHFAASVGLHAAVAALIAVAILLPHQAPRPAAERTSLTPLVSPYARTASEHQGSDGSGGASEQMDASRGALPPTSRQQFAPPVVIPPRESRLRVDATIVSPDPTLPRPDQVGNPLSALTPLSNGRAPGGGIGNHSGGGVGDGDDNGFGHGGDRGSVYTFGNGVTAPRLLYGPEPDFSEEARKAKYQGTVTLRAVIGTDGRPRNIRVQQSLGMGLDEKAKEALSAWRFQPGMKDGYPVAVEMMVEVNFHLF